MKFKRLTAIILTLILSVSTVYASDEIYKDVKDSDFKDEIEILYKLDILKGYENGTFGPDDFITRGEFATVISNMFNYKTTNNADCDFTDIASDYWAKGAIDFVKKSGYMNGYSDNTFRPNNFISNEEVFITLVNALGYKYKTSANFYGAVAKELGITKGVKSPLSDFAKRKEVAKYVMNAMLVDIAEKTSIGTNEKFEIKEGENILKKYHNVIYDEGIVSANDLISIDVKTAKENSVIINGIEILYDDYFVRDYVGKNVKFMYEINKEEDKNKLIYIKENNVKEIKVDIYDFEYFDGETFSYLENNEVKKLKLKRNASVFKNGEYFNLLKNSFNEIKEGEVRFISTKNNSYYDVIFISEYKDIVVDKINYSTGKVTSKLDKSVSLNLCDNKKMITLFDSSNKIIKKEDIKKDNVLTLKDGSEITEVYVSDKTVKGIKSKTEKEIFTENESYFIEKSVRNLYKNSFDFENIAFIDIRNRVSFFKDPKLIGSIGFLVKLGKKDENLSEKLSAKIFTQDGEMVLLKFNDKFFINDKLFKSPTLKEVTDEIKGSSDSYNKMILIKTDEDEKITSVNTATPYRTLMENNENKFCEVAYMEELRNSRDNASLGDKILYKKHENPIMAVPENIEEADDNDYKMLTADDLEENEIYTVSAYNLGVDYGICDVIMIKTDKAESKLSSSYEPCAIVTKRVKTVNSDGAEINRVYCISGKKDTYFDYPIGKVIKDFDENNEKEALDFTADDLDTGDVIRFNMDINHELAAFDIYFKMQDDGKYKYVSGMDNKELMNRGTVLFMSEVKRYNGTHISVYFNSKDEYDYKMFGEPLHQNYHKVTITKQNKPIITHGTSADIEVGDFVILQFTYTQLMSVTVVKYL